MGTISAVLTRFISRTTRGVLDLSTQRLINVIGISSVSARVTTIIESRIYETLKPYCVITLTNPKTHGVCDPHSPGSPAHIYVVPVDLPVQLQTDAVFTRGKSLPLVDNTVVGR